MTTETQKLIEMLSETVAAPMAATSAAFVHLIQHLHNAGVVNKATFADSLEATAKVQPAELMNAEAFARHVYKLAQQIRDARSVDAPTQMQ